MSNALALPALPNRQRTRRRSLHESELHIGSVSPYRQRNCASLLYGAALPLPASLVRTRSVARFVLRFLVNVLSAVNLHCGREICRECQRVIDIALAQVERVKKAPKKIGAGAGGPFVMCEDLDAALEEKP